MSEKTVSDMIAELPPELVGPIAEIVNKAVHGAVTETSKQANRLIGIATGDEQAYLARVGDMTPTERDDELDSLLNAGLQLAADNQQTIAGQKDLAQRTVAALMNLGIAALGTIGLSGLINTPDVT